MTFLERAKNFWKKITSPTLPYSWDVGYISEKIGSSEDMEYFTGWAYAAIVKIAQGIAKSKWVLYRLENNKVVEVEDHELLGLLHKVNPKMTEFDFKELLAINGEIFGRMPLILFRGTDGKPSEMWPAIPYCLSPKTKDEYGNVLSWRYEIGNKKIEFLAEDVIDLKYPNPSNPFEGLAPISAIKDVLDLHKMMNAWNIGFLRNNARPSMIIKLPYEITDAQRKKLEKMFQEQYQGYENVYKRALFLAAGVEVDKAGFSPSEIEFKESKIEIRDEILSILGVPKSILGLESNVNRASMEQAEINFAKYTLEPKLRKITEQLNEFLVPKFDENLYLDFEPLVDEDREIRLQEFDKGYNRWLSTNEIRKKMGLPPIGGGDYIYMPINLLPSMGSKGFQVKKLEVKETEEINLETQKRIRKAILARSIRQRKRAEKISQKFQNAVRNRKKVILKIVSSPKSSTNQKLEKKKSNIKKIKETFWKQRMLREGESEKRWKEEFLKLFKEQKKEVLNNLKKKKSQKKLIDDILFNEKRAVRATIAIMEPLYIEDLQGGAREASELIGIEPIDILNIPQVKNWLEYVCKKYAKEITETTVEDLAVTLSDGIEEGEGLYELGNRIEDYFEKIAPERADMIARTETARATIEAHRATWEEAGFNKVEWLLAPGACPECEEKAGQEWEIKTIEGEIPVHPNCKCDFIPQERS